MNRFVFAVVPSLWLAPFLVLSLWPVVLLPARSGVLWDFAVLCLLLAVTRFRRALAILLVLPVVISAVQLGNWLFTGQLIDVYTLMTFTATNLAESSGFASLLLSSQGPWLLGGGLALALTLVGLRRSRRVPARHLLVAASLSMLLYLGLWLATKQRLPTAEDLGKLTFYGHVGAVSAEFHRHFFQPEAPQPPIADLTPGAPQVDAILVVFGESTTTYRMSAYGYGRETTPHIARADVLFQDVVAVGLNTQPNVQALTTGEVGVIRQQHPQDIFRIARQSGYTSHYIDNNRFVSRDPMYLIARQADAYDSLNGIGETNPRNDHKIQHDEVVLPLFRAAMARTQGQRRILFVHLVGSHFNHDLRYPPSFNRFPSHYDNAVRYTDHIVQTLHTEFMAGTRNQTAMMIYVSDHGVKIPPGCSQGPVPTDEVANYGNDERYHSNLSVPLAVWFNPALRQAQPERVARMVQARALPVDQRFLMWTVADAMGLKRVNGQAVAELSLFSPTARYQPRYNTRGQDIDALLAKGEICRPDIGAAP